MQATSTVQETISQASKGVSLLAETQHGGKTTAAVLLYGHRTAAFPASSCPSNVQVRESISGQFTDDAPGSRQGAEAPKEPAAQPASQQASASAQPQQPPSAEQSSASEAASPSAASSGSSSQQQQQQQQQQGTTGRPFMGQESQSGRQQAGAESGTGGEQAGAGQQAGPGGGASSEEQPGQAGSKQPRESVLSRVQRAARAVRSEVCPHRRFCC